jgi:hypothetical protein
MLLIEYRIKLPIEFSKYHIGHLYSIIEMSKEYTSKNEGVEILENTFCDDARLPNQKKSKGIEKIQRTSKRYYIPDSLVSEIGLSGCILKETEYNGFPNMRTTCTDETGTEFVIDTICKEISDLRNSDNIFRLPRYMLDKREIVEINVDESEHSMIVYKLLMINDMEQKISSFIVKTLTNAFTLCHKKLIETFNTWNGLTIEDIRKMEIDLKDILDQKRSSF